MVHRCASIAVAIQARACMGLCVRARCHPYSPPAPGAQPALNPCLCPAKCTAVQNLEQLKQHCLLCVKILQRRRERPGCVHTALPAFCHHQQHDMTISSTRQWSLLLSARQEKAGLCASSKNGSRKRLDGPARDPAMMNFTTKFKRLF